MTEQKQDQKAEEEIISQEDDPLSELFEERDRSPLEENNNNIEKCSYCREKCHNGRICYFDFLFNH